jgi:hypothetical protein
MRLGGNKRLQEYLEEKNAYYDEAYQRYSSPHAEEYRFLLACDVAEYLGWGFFFF